MIARHQLAASLDANTSVASRPASASAAAITSRIGAAGSRARRDRCVLTPRVRYCPENANSMCRKSIGAVTNSPGRNPTSSAVAPAPTNRTLTAVLGADAGPIGDLDVGDAGAARDPVPDLTQAGGGVSDRRHLRVRRHADHRESGFQAGCEFCFWSFVVDSSLSSCGSCLVFGLGVMRRRVIDSSFLIRMMWSFVVLIAVALGRPRRPAAPVFMPTPHRPGRPKPAEKSFCYSGNAIAPCVSHMWGHRVVVAVTLFNDVTPSVPRIGRRGLCTRGRPQPAATSEVQRRSGCISPTVTT